MPEYVSPVKAAQPEIDIDAIDAMLKNIVSATDSIAVAGKVAHDVRVAFNLTQEKMAAAMPAIKPGRLAKLDRGQEQATAHEARLLMLWVKDLVGRKPTADDV